MKYLVSLLLIALCAYVLAEEAKPESMAEEDLTGEEVNYYRRGHGYYGGLYGRPYYGGYYGYRPFGYGGYGGYRRPYYGGFNNYYGGYGRGFGFGGLYLG